MEAVGPGVQGPTAGSHVILVHTWNTWREQIVCPVDRLVPVPDGLDDPAAATSYINPERAGGRRRFGAISSMTTGRTSMIIRSGRRGCKRRSRSFWCSGRHDLSFDPREPERYRKDVPNAQVYVLDAGQFALDTKADEIAVLVSGFMKTMK